MLPRNAEDLAGHLGDGSPTIEPGPEPDTMIARFWWQDPDHETTPPDWVYVDITGITDRPWFHEGSMRRVEGTDLWCLSIVIPAEWRGSYGFTPGRGRPRPGTDSAGRRWWADIFSRIQPDPFNPSPRFRSLRGGHYSETAMPGAPPQRWVFADDAGSGQTPTRHARMTLGGAERSIWVSQHGSGTSPQSLVVLFDGQYWAREAPILSGLDRLAATGNVVPFAVVYVDSVDSATRFTDLTTSETFRTDLIEKLIPWVSARLHLSDDPQAHIVAGQSLGGMGAVDLVLARPDMFAGAIAQSAALWWSGSGSGEEPRWTWPERLAAAPTGDLRFWLEVGSLEANMADVTRQFAADAASAGVSVTLREFCGGHDVVHWRDGLVEGLAHLLETPAEGL